MRSGEHEHFYLIYGKVRYEDGETRVRFYCVKCLKTIIKHDNCTCDIKENDPIHLS